MPAPAAETRWLQCCNLLLAAWLLACAGWLAFGALPSPDDAMFLSVPKNWLLGYGWATSFSDKIPFNPDFTAGPTVLMPAAGLIALFGNTWWIAGATGALLNLSLLAACLWRVQRSWNHSAVMVLALLLLTFAVRLEDISNLIGYYTASLLLLLMILLAFDHALAPGQRGVWLGLLGALALHAKPLALPGVVLVWGLWAWHIQRQGVIPARQWPVLLAGLLVPAAVLLGGWSAWRAEVLAEYPSSFQAAWQAYGQSFFEHHGSGLYQWQQAADKWELVSRNIDRNLFHIEHVLAQHQLRRPFLGEAPADPLHVMGVLWLLLVLASSLAALRRCLRDGQAFDWAMLALGTCSLAYFTWFLCIAMAMSAGHAYFPLQWSLWLLVLQLAQWLAGRCPRGPVLAMALAAVATCLLPAHNRSLLWPGWANLPSPTAQLQARDFLLSRTFLHPLAGCGYGGYPRHLEYLLPGSQNFRDCYHLIEDHLQLDEAAYYRDNGLDPRVHPNARAHFNAHVGITPGLRYHFRWRDAPLDFTLVLSMQSQDNAIRLGPVVEACLHNVLYRNEDVLVLDCRDAALRASLDPDFMMSEIAINHRWYRTRL